MRIMYKFASRSRPDALFKALDNIQKFAKHDDYFILITADLDDVSMTNKEVNARVQQYKNTAILYGTSKSKIDAINRDMALYTDWDILINMSDDMEFIRHGFDLQIISDYNSLPGGDVLMHYPDQKAGFAMITMAIMDRKYYNRDGYIYNPAYKSLWCDNEQMEVAQIRKRYKFFKSRLFNHNNPMHGLSPKDELHLKTLADHKEDKATFLKRKADNFI